MVFFIFEIKDLDCVICVIGWRFLLKFEHYWIRNKVIYKVKSKRDSGEWTEAETQKSAKRERSLEVNRWPKNEKHVRIILQKTIIYKRQLPIKPTMSHRPETSNDSLILGKKEIDITNRLFFIFGEFRLPKSGATSNNQNLSRPKKFQLF